MAPLLFIFLATFTYLLPYIPCIKRVLLVYYISWAIPVTDYLKIKLAEIEVDEIVYVNH